MSRRWITGWAGVVLLGGLTGCSQLAGMPGLLGATRADSAQATFANGSPVAPMAGGNGSKAMEGDASGHQESSGLQGSEIDDNADFAKYLAYSAAYSGESIVRVNVSQRVQFLVTDSASKSMPNAEVTVKLAGEPIFQGKSAADGRVIFCPLACMGSSQATGGFDVQVTKGDASASFSLARDASGSVPVPLTASRGTLAPKLDITFVLDVTGSMSDELDRLQRTIADITARIKTLNGDPQVRFGLVAYRDLGDDFVNRSWDFTSDLSVFKTRLNTLSATGGGDYPEAVNEALDAALHGLSWDDGETTRLIFLVGDAPPQMGSERDPAKFYSRSMVTAVASGIKIFPLAASGLDGRGEYIFRQVAQYTGSKFLFLTYNGQTDMNVGPVQVNNLDDLVVGIVRGELSNLE